MATLPVSTATSPRLVLEGVPRIAFEEHDGKVELTPFPSSLKACLEFIGQPCAYHYLMGTTGAAFRLSWRPGWHFDNVDIKFMSNDPAAPFRRAFAAVGRAYEFIAPEGGHTEAIVRERIVASLKDGRPVLGLGVVGPPEACIITGYDEGGDVLIGWSFFQQMPEFLAGVEFEPSGYFRKRSWFAALEGLIVINEHLERPALGMIYRDALRWALQVVRTPNVNAYGHARANGLAAYDAWADQLLDDADFPACDIGVLRQRFLLHDDTTMGQVGEGRWNAALFLKDVAAHEPAMREDLLAAAACYEAEHDLMWRIWDLEHARSPDLDVKARTLSEPDVRRAIVTVIRAARARDAEAADHIERALSR